jgi:predicted esterase YcpF (UPF0227 family)
MIVYLHGFRSSPQSFKARLIGERMRDLGLAGQYRCPQLSERPATAMAAALDLTGRIAPAQLTLIGSSLGGFYATWLAETLGCRAVLLNPAMRAHEKLVRHVGTQTAYHDASSSFEFRAEYLDELRTMHVETITRPERYFVLAATGDELLDWREMTGAFPGAKRKVIQGSDHGMADFADHMDEVLAFAGVLPAAPD